MIFSDLARQKGVFSQAKGIMNKLAFNLRHYNCSIIIDTQALRQINSAFRENFSGIILFAGITNRMEIGKIYDEYLGQYYSSTYGQIVLIIFFLSISKKRKVSNFLKTLIS